MPPPLSRILRLTGALLFAAGCLSAFLVPTVSAQNPDAEEVVVQFQVRRLLATDLYVWYDGEQIFLPVGEVFDLLDLYVDYDRGKEILSGYVIDRSQPFRFDLGKGEVVAGGKRGKLPNDEYFVTETDFYLRVDRFVTYFGLPIEFNFADLRVTLPLNEDFPAFRKLQRALAHRRLNQDKEKLGDIKNLPYRRSMLGGAVADWSLAATPIGGGAQYFNINTGGMVGGGDLSFSATGNSETGVDADQFTWRWHYFVDTASIVTQFELGDLFIGGSGGPLARRLRGAAVTNRPQTQRKFFRTITVEGHLGEGWEVEMYVDQKLTNFMYTGPDGRYEFTVDLYYGASLVTLKMYGPNGEIRTDEQYIRVPYNLIPERTFEYSLLVGTQPADTLTGWYTQGSAFYGITRRLTAGVGVDLPISGATEEPPAFEVQSSFQPTGNLTLNGSYSPNYVAGFAFNFNKPSLVSLDGNVAFFSENEYHNRIRQQRSMAVSLSAPMRIRQKPINFRYYLAWNTFAESDQITMHYGFNTSINRISFYYLGKYRIQKYQQRSLSSILSEVFASVSITRWLRPQFRVAYDHTNNELDRVSLFLNKRIFRSGQLSFTAERDFPSKTNVFRVTFNLFTDFADFSSRAAYSRGQATLSQVQHGSVRYDQQSHQMLFDRYYGVGRSTAVVRPFLDGNFNGQFDEHEEAVPGLRARVQGGRERPRDGRSVFYYDGLNPYDEHLVQIDPLSLDNPLLKPVFEGYRVPLNPNMVTTIDVPLVITGEAEGMVRRRVTAGEIGQGGIKVQFYHQTKESVTEVMTFSNGEYFYLGLIPGRYRAYVDPAQLQRLGYRSEPEYIEFDLEAIDGGGTVSDLDFNLIPQEPTEP